jgi:integrase
MQLFKDLKGLPINFISFYSQVFIIIITIILSRPKQSAHIVFFAYHNPYGYLNKKFTPHCFWHFFTTWMRRAGCPRSIIQELRGDSRKEAIDIYDHITQTELKESYLRYIPKLDIKL